MEKCGFSLSDYLEGAGTKLDGRRSLKRTSIVCYLMIEDLGGEVTRLTVMVSLTKTKLALFVTW